MANRIMDDLWSEQSSRWFLPPPPQIFVSPNISPMNAFRDYLNPMIDRLSSRYVPGNLFDYHHLLLKRGLRMPGPPNPPAKPVDRQYEILNCIGKGGYGAAYDARRKFDNSSVVIKCLPRDRILNWGTHRGARVPYEIEILWRLRGVPGVVQILQHFEEPDRFIFTMEKVPQSVTLFDLVMDSPPLENTELLRHLFREMVRLNTTLQTFGIWHRDCKPENIIYCHNDRALMFIDFGSAAPMQPGDFTEFQGTLEIMVPEWILQKRYDGEKSCVWALGVCLYFLLFREYPFRSKTDIVNGRSRLASQTSSDKNAYNTMRQCLHGNEHRRPTLSQLLSSPWLA